MQGINETEKEICPKCKRKKVWYDFIYTNEWNLFVNFVKIIGVIMIVWLSYTIITDIHALQILNYDACAYCMNKTGAQCFSFGGFK